jgi:hypothetical protein
MHEELNDEIFGIMENQDGEKIKIILVEPNAINGEDLHAIPTLDPDETIVAINIVTLKMMVQEMGTEEIHKDLAKAAIAAAATCPPELSLEEL